MWSQAGGHVPNLSIILCMGLEVGGDSIWLVTAGIRWANAGNTPRQTGELHH